MEDNSVIVISDTEDDDNQDNSDVGDVKQDPRIQIMIQRCIQEIMNETNQLSKQNVQRGPVVNPKPILLNGHTSIITHDDSSANSSSLTDKQGLNTKANHNFTLEAKGENSPVKCFPNIEEMKETEKAKIENISNEQKELTPQKHNCHLIPYSCLNYKMSKRRADLKRLSTCEYSGFHKAEVSRSNLCLKELKCFNRLRKSNLKRLLYKNIQYLKSVKTKLKKDSLRTCHKKLVIDENNFGKMSKYYIYEGFSDTKLVYVNKNHVVTNLYMDYFPLFKQAVQNKRIEVVKKLKKNKLSNLFAYQRRKNFCKDVQTFHFLIEHRNLINNIIKEHSYSINL